MTGPATLAPAERRPEVRSRTYPPREDTELLLRFVRRCTGLDVLELGTGPGTVAFAAVRAGARTVVATDLNPFALREARARAEREGLEVALVRTNLARGLGRFDRILANPPYLPTSAAQRDRDPWTNLALDGGRDGCRVLARIVRTLRAHLRSGGAGFVVVSSVQDPRSRERIRSGWERRGGRVRVVGRRPLEGETLEVWELRPARTDVRRSRRVVRRTGRPDRGRRGHRRTLRAIPRGSSPGPASGRTSARGGASSRRRSPPGS